MYQYKIYALIIKIKIQLKFDVSNTDILNKMDIS